MQSFTRLRSCVALKHTVLPLPRYRRLAISAANIASDTSSRSTATGIIHVPPPPLPTPVVPPTSNATAPDLHAALNTLRMQPSHYVVASLYDNRYLLAPRDLLSVPRIKNLAVGEVISLDKVHELGSRDYTLRGDPYLEPGVVSVKATVIEHTKGEMERIVKKKRRKGYKKTIEHKQTYTRLRIGDIVIGG